MSAISTHYKILLIDDDEDDFVHLRDTLGEIPQASYQLTWQPSFKEGLTALVGENFDACILDYRLGLSTGLDLLAEAQKRKIKCPMILLTGHGDIDLDLKAMEAGAADYLVKGQISPPLLERAIRYAVKNASDMREIADERENFQTLFNSTFEGIVVHCEGKITAANRAVCDIFKCTEEEIAGRHLTDFLRDDFREDFSSRLRAGRDLEMEAVGITFSGDEIFLGILSRTVSLKGKWASLVAIRDLTERKMMESQILLKDRLASLGLLASSLAHEIGTPLGVIRGRAELLQKSSDGKTKETMELIVSQIDRIAKLVNSLLHIARNRDAGRAADVNLHPVLTDVLALLSQEIEKNGIHLSLDVADELVVQAESGPLGQVFLNLLVNAIHAIIAVSPEKARPRHIRINATELDREVHVAISDTGTGIEDQDFSRLFQPFFTTKAIGEGTGLGLATSYKIVSSWGGSIQAESKIGQGSTFTVILRK